MTTKDHTTEVAKISGAPAGLAAFAENQDNEVAQAMKAERVLTRLKRIQGQSDDALKSQHGEGAVILHPTGAKIASRDEWFAFVPLFFFKEYTKDSDLADTDADFILERSYDARGELALRAKDKERRFEDYPDGRKKPNGDPMRYRYVEHFVFPGVLYGGDVHLTPTVLSFEKGEAYQGRNFCSAWDMRKVNTHNAPLWSCVWNFKSVLRTRGTNNWFGLDFENPENPYITEEELEPFSAAANELKMLHADNLLVVDRSDGNADDAASVVIENDDAM